MESVPETMPEVVPPDIGLTDSQITRLLVLLVGGVAALLLFGGLAMALLDA